MKIVNYIHKTHRKQARIIVTKIKLIEKKIVLNKIDEEASK